MRFDQQFLRLAWQPLLLLPAGQQAGQVAPALLAGRIQRPDPWLQQAVAVVQQSGLLWQLCAESGSGLLQEMSATWPGLQQVPLQRCRWRLAGVGLARQTVEGTVQSVQLRRPLGLGLRAELGPVLEQEVLEQSEVQS